MVPKKMANRCQALSVTPAGKGKHQMMTAAKTVIAARSSRFREDMGAFELLIAGLVALTGRLDYSMQRSASTAGSQFELHSRLDTGSLEFKYTKHRPEKGRSQNDNPLLC